MRKPCVVAEGVGAMSIQAPKTNKAIHKQTKPKKNQNFHSVSKRFFVLSIQVGLRAKTFESDVMKKPLNVRTNKELRRIQATPKHE